MSERRCQTCRWWDKYTNGQEGYCGILDAIEVPFWYQGGNVTLHDQGTSCDTWKKNRSAEANP